MSAPKPDTEAAAAERAFEDVTRKSLAIYNSMDEVLAKAQAPTISVLVALRLLMVKAIRQAESDGLPPADSAKAVALVMVALESTRGGDA